MEASRSLERRELTGMSDDDAEGLYQSELVNHVKITKVINKNHMMKVCQMSAVWQTEKNSSKNSKVL